MPKDEVLASAAIGTGLDELIKKCGDRLRPAEPPAPASGAPIAVTMSGGGFRATLPALGVIRLLADAGLLDRLRYTSSVSGGSVANAVLATAWPEIRKAGYTSAAVDRHVIEPVIKKISKRSLKVKLIRNVWRIVGSKTRTELLADAFDDWWLDGAELEHLDPEVRWIINAGNVTTGVRYGFERDVAGDYVLGLSSTAGSGVRVATAAAASAAVPGAFAQIEPEGLTYPCGDRGAARLLDGGIYDNTGLEALDGRKYDNVFTLTLDAGGIFSVGKVGGLPIAGDLMRANSMLYRQSTAVRTRWMVERFTAGTRAGTLFKLATDVNRPGGDVEQFIAAYAEHRDWDGRDLAFVGTSFDKFDEGLCRRLVYRGWWLAGAHIARWNSADYPLPSMTPPPID